MERVSVTTFVPYPVTSLDAVADWPAKSAVGVAQLLEAGKAAALQLAAGPAQREIEVFMPRSFRLGPSDYRDPKPEQPVVLHNGQLKKLGDELAQFAEERGLECTGIRIDVRVAGNDVANGDGVLVKLKKAAQMQRV